MFILTLFGNLLIGNGFGLNTNILETNIINLAVVIAVVFIFVGDALKTVLEDRKQIILVNLREADQKTNEVRNKMEQVQSQLELAKKKVIEIQKEGHFTAEQQKLQIFNQAEKESIRLEELKKEKIERQEQKLFLQVLEQGVLLSIAKVREKITKFANEDFHLAFNQKSAIELEAALENFYTTEVTDQADKV